MRKQSALLSGLLAVALSSPHPRSWSVRALIQSATTTAVCPRPHTVHVHDLSANSTRPRPRPVRELAETTTCPWPWPVPGFDQSKS